MNKVHLIGNLTKDVELRSTKDGIQVASFTIAVSGKKDEVQFIRCTAWRALADLCSKYLTKGKKVCVIGSVSASAYIDKEGKAKASLEVTADEIEFLSPKVLEADVKNSAKDEVSNTQVKKDKQTGFDIVDDSSDLPF